MKKTNRITVSFPEREYAALESIAREQDSSMSWVVRRAVSEFMDKYPASQQEEFLLKSVDAGVKK